MARLIDANALKMQFIAYVRTPPHFHYGDWQNMCINGTEIDDVIENAPTVQAVEVVHAEWACVNESENVWMCTGKNGCGNEVLLLEGTPSENGWYYCPNCGAKMDGGNEDA